MNLLFSTFESAGHFLWQTGLRGLVIFVVAIGLVFFLRRRSAAVRHLVWTTTLLTALALPILSLVVPPWRILKMPAMFEPASRFSRHEQPDTAVPVTRREFEGSASAETDIARGVTATVLPANQPIHMPSQISRGASNFRVSVFTIWLAGALAVIIPNLIGWWRVLGRCRQTPKIEDPEWLGLLEKSKVELRVRRPVSLRYDPLTSVPATAGFWHPAIFLPENAMRWPRQRRRLVLLHELAHIRRSDWLTQTLALFACAVHWFNPLAWFIAGQARREQELACDDLVLGCRIAPDVYAEELLGFAATFGRRDSFSSICVPMARPSSLNERLAAVLDESRSRNPLTRALIVWALVIPAVLVIPVAIVAAADEKTATQPHTSSPVPRFKPVARVVLPSAVDSPRYWSLSDGHWHSSPPDDKPSIHLDRDSKSEWQLVVEDAYNYRLDSKEGAKLWDSMTAAEAAEPAGLAAVPFERNGFYRVSNDEMPLTILLPGIGLIQLVEPVESSSFSVLLRCKLLTMDVEAPPGEKSEIGGNAADRSSLSAARNVVREWLDHTGADRIDLVWPLTTRSSDAAPSVDLQKTWEFKNIRPAWSLGNDSAAMVVSNRFNDNAGRQRALVFTLEKHDGRWLIREQFSESPENVYRHIAGFAAHAGIRYDVPAENFVGQWKHVGFLGVFESTLVLRADGTGTIVEKQRGEKAAEKSLRWTVSGDRFSWKADSEMTAGIIRLEHDFFALKIGEGQVGYHRETSAQPKDADAPRRGASGQNPDAGGEKSARPLGF